MHRRIVPIAFLLVAVGCQRTTEPEALTLRDVDQARDAWLAKQPEDYTFDLAVASSWFPRSGYARITVTNRAVASVVPARDALVTRESAVTLDSVWTIILTTRVAGTLNAAMFTLDGVPLEVDWGPWASDGGVRYSVRRFVRRR